MARTYAKKTASTKLSSSAGHKLGGVSRTSPSTIANPLKTPATDFKKTKSPDILDDPFAFASFGRTALDGEN